jgi:hypothetical protein
MGKPSEKDTGKEGKPLLRVECYAGHGADSNHGGCSSAKERWP